jgi:hypothetical protein
VREHVEKLGAADAEDFRALALRCHAHFVLLGHGGTLQFLGELGRASAQHGKLGSWAHTSQARRAKLARPMADDSSDP